MPDEPRMSGQPLTREVARAAAGWLALIHSGEAGPADLAACQRWRAEAPEHEQAWQRAERLAGMLGGLPGGAGMAVLGRSDRGGRRQFAKTLLALLTAAPVAYATWRAWDDGLVGQLTAAQHTATGERRRLVLDDGGILHLNTATAVDIAYGEDRREIRLHDGEILIETAPDHARTPPRPFTVRTTHGRLRALGTRFVVRTEGGAAAGNTHLTVLEGAVEVAPRHASAATLVVQAGEQARFGAAAIGKVEAAATHTGDWSRGLLVADNLRLADFAAELGRHRPGILRCDPAVADLRITGAFQLDNIDATLAALPDTLPVSVVYRTRWWVGIVAPRG
ncbi:DUF4880 domain-containing protein [Pseudothauera nasutitermitis]|uniref:DUF4880 domain-containing protein n=2 Tax=Pseudothauera nasutitermitis TaxID=2565930 RepID=A0A4S4B5D7_9RHOO|nr:DUF4880 domain-containing protein [Pseudothauera nasutitermitis]